MSRHWKILLTIALVVAPIASACVPPAPPGPQGPPGGCYDNVNPLFPDYEYSGTPDVLGNMTYFNSQDGTCTGGSIQGDDTLVLAGSKAEAETLCTSIGGSIVSDVTWADQGWTALPATAWPCT